MGQMLLFFIRLTFGSRVRPWSGVYVGPGLKSKDNAPRLGLSIALVRKSTVAILRCSMTEAFASCRANRTTAGKDPRTPSLQPTILQSDPKRDSTKKRYRFASLYSRLGPQSRPRKRLDEQASDDNDDQSRRDGQLARAGVGRGVACLQRCAQGLEGPSFSNWCAATDDGECAERSTFPSSEQRNAFLNLRLRSQSLRHFCRQGGEKESIKRNKKAIFPARESNLIEQFLQQLLRLPDLRVPYTNHCTNWDFAEKPCFMDASYRPLSTRAGFR